MESSEWLYLSVRDRYWWCPCHDINPCWPVRPKTEQDFQALVRPRVKRDVVHCVTSSNNCVGLARMAPLCFPLTTKQSRSMITALTCDGFSVMAQASSFTCSLLHLVNQVFCFHGILSYTTSDHSPSFLPPSFLSQVSRPTCFRVCSAIATLSIRTTPLKTVCLLCMSIHVLYLTDLIVLGHPTAHQLWLLACSA